MLKHKFDFRGYLDQGVPNQNGSWSELFNKNWIRIHNSVPQLINLGSRENILHNNTERRIKKANLNLALSL